MLIEWYIVLLVYEAYLVFQSLLDTRRVHVGSIALTSSGGRQQGAAEIFEQVPGSGTNSSQEKKEKPLQFPGKRSPVHMLFDRIQKNTCSSRCIFLFYFGADDI